MRSGRFIFDAQVNILKKIRLRRQHNLSELVIHSIFIFFYYHHHNSSENSMQRVQIPLNLYINWELKVLGPLDPAKPSYTDTNTETVR